MRMDLPVREGLSSLKKEPPLVQRTFLPVPRRVRTAPRGRSLALKKMTAVTTRRRLDRIP